MDPYWKQELRSFFDRQLRHHGVSCSSCGIDVNTGLTARTTRHDVELHYVEPTDVLRFALGELSPRVTLRHGLVPDDVYLSVYRPRQ